MDASFQHSKLSMTVQYFNVESKISLIIMNVSSKMEGEGNTTHQEIALKFINLFSVGSRSLEEIESKFQELVKYVHQDFILIMLPYRDPRVFHGVEGLWQIITENKEGLPDLDIEVIGIYGENLFIAVHVIYRATHTALIVGMPSSGKKIENDSVYLFKFNEDKLIELRVVSDTLTIFLQLGQAIILENEQEQIDEYIKILRNLGLLPKT